MWSFCCSGTCQTTNGLSILFAVSSLLQTCECREWTLNVSVCACTCLAGIKRDLLYSTDRGLKSQLGLGPSCAEHRTWQRTVRKSTPYRSSSTNVPEGDAKKQTEEQRELLWEITFQLPDPFSSLQLQNRLCLKSLSIAIFWILTLKTNILDTCDPDVKKMRWNFPHLCLWAIRPSSKIRKCVCLWSFVCLCLGDFETFSSKYLNEENHQTKTFLMKNLGFKKWPPSKNLPVIPD